jgi:hypothetical protein
MASTGILRKDLDVSVVTSPLIPPIARSLLVSADPTTVEQVTSAMDGLAIATEVCADTTIARQILNTQKFDAVAIDFELGEQAPGLLGEMRLSPSNKTAPAIAITRSQPELALAYCAGSNFVLQKPLTPQSINRMLVAGYGLVVRERRRYFRCPIKTPVLIRRADLPQARCTTVNVSEGGLEIASVPLGLRVGMKAQIEFTLACPQVRVKAIFETRWRNRRNHAGLQFVVMSLEQRCDLQEWLATRLEEVLPESVVDRFREAGERFRFEEVNAPRHSFHRK